MTHEADDFLDCLPHAPPFRFLTGGIKLWGDNEGKGFWRVTPDEPALSGHFPGRPIVPGVLIVESLAQLSGIIAAQRFVKERANRPAGGSGPAPTAKLAHVDVRFKETVVPPAELEIHSRLERALGGLRHFSVRATLNDRTVAQGTLTLSLDQATETAAEAGR